MMMMMMMAGGLLHNAGQHHTQGSEITIGLNEVQIKFEFYKRSPNFGKNTNLTSMVACVACVA